MSASTGEFCSRIVSVLPEHALSDFFSDSFATISYLLAESRQYRPAGRMEALLDRSTESSSRITTLGPVQTDQNSSLHLHPRTLLTPNRHSTVSSQRCPQKGQQLTSQSLTSSPRKMSPPFYSSYSVAARRGRAWSLGRTDLVTSTRYKLSPEMVPTGKNAINVASAALAKAQALQARKENDAMVYLDGAQIYTCGQCRTHLTSHDDIISKSFHGHHGKSRLCKISFRFFFLKSRFLISVCSYLSLL